MEKWDILNSAGEPTGETVVRSANASKEGQYHLVVHIWIVSSMGKFLIQRRADDKKLMPGEWAATGGAAISGEDSFTAAQRELFEELGIMSDKTTLKKALRLKRRNSLLDIWFIKSDVDTSKLKLQESEVAEAKWVTAEELKEMVKNEEFHNYGNEYFVRVFDIISQVKGATV